MKLSMPFTRKEQKALVASADNADTIAISPAATKAIRKRARKRRGWVRLLALAVLALAVGGGIYAWQMQTSAQVATTSVALPVTQGDLSVSVESSGKVQATSAADVKYETQGEVLEVMVKQGDHVEAGQPLVRLSDDDQKLAVDQAQAALNTAQAELDDLKLGSSESDIKSAQADLQAAQAELQSVKAGASKKEIADAEADLRAAQAALEQVKSGATPKQIVDAEADLRAAQAALEQVKSGASAKEIKDAEADLQAAQAALAGLKEPPSISEVKAAESDLKSAQARLADLKAGPSAADLGQERAAVTQAETALQKIKNDAGLKKQEAELALAKADRDLVQAQRDYGKVAGELLNENGDLTVDASDPRYDQYWQAYNALKDAEATQTRALAELENVRQNEIADVAQAEADLSDARLQLEDAQTGATTSELADAQATVDKAQMALDALSAGPSTDDLTTAETNVTKAQSKLDDLKAGADKDEIAAAESTVVQAQTKLDELKAGPTGTDLADAQTQVDKAQNKLSDLRAGPTQADISAAEAQVAQQEAALQKVLEPATASEIAAAEESIVKAQEDLQDAQAELEKTTLRAPFSGVISEVAAEANSAVTVGDAAVSLYDPEGMRLDLDVSESDIEKVKVGQSAAITIDAIPNAAITGTVTSVSPVATSGQDVVNYKVQVTFNPADLPVKVGMSANAAMTVETKQDVMQIPNRAITTAGPFKTIQVLYTKDGKETPVTVRVTTGLTDGTMTEITGCVDTNNQCLRAGDRVAMTLQTTTTGQQGFPRDAVIQFGVGPGPGQGSNARPFVAPIGP